MSVSVKSVLISDAVDNACVHLLQESGIRVTCRYKMSERELLDEIKNHDGLIVRSDTKVTAELLAAATSLKVVGRAGTGVDNINIDAATRKGVIVLNTPGGNSTSACELTCALITALARNIAQACQSLKEGRWDRKLYTGNELAGKTIAVLGLGRIGREVAVRMQAFGMRTIGFDPMVTAELAQAFHVEKMDLSEIWPLADYITVHTPLIPQTRNLLNDDVFNKCKRGVRIINVARGGIVDEAALLRALQDGRCGAAALDVFCEEPPTSPGTLELIQHPKVIVTPHLGASTCEAQQRVAVEIAEQFIALASNVEPQIRARYSITGVVNAPVLAAAMVRDNTPWIMLANELGKLVAKMMQGVVQGTKIQITTSGAAMESKKFLGAAVLAGMLSGCTKNGLNLINAPILAQEAGMQVTVHHETTDSPGTVKVSVTQDKLGCRSLRGTVKTDELPYLLSVDDANFEQGVLLGSNVQLFQGCDSMMNLGTIVSELITRGAIITSVAVALGKSAWFAVRAEHQVDNLDIPGVIPF
ncbi:D-3-phosphoglycerate dehydrogenase [Anabrus simplex]|uniref:D-3-phosphoglycerate dehydrogenase n=1 Tax=Anabrus simplex TaxID=316456 RepID=UPI0035A3C8F7